MRFQKLSISVSQTLNGMPFKQTVSGRGKREEGRGMAHVSYRKHNCNFSILLCHAEMYDIRKALNECLAEIHKKRVTNFLVVPLP